MDAGLELLGRGGTAVDAAVGMAAALTVVEPTSNGIGGDAFALVWAEGKLHGLNASGRSPRLLTAEKIRSRGHHTMPETGWLPVTVPGAPAGWRDLHHRFGKLPFPEVLAPAIRFATGGQVVPKVVAKYWARAAGKYGALEGPEFEGWRETFTRDGIPPAEGDLVTLTDHAETLSRIADTDAVDFYRGELADRIDAFSRETGGFLRKEDLADHTNLWADPLSVGYRDVELWELPPNGQGIVALAALGILDGLPPGRGWDDPEGIHAAIEAVKLGFADARAHLADPEHMTHAPAEFLAESYLGSRREEIGDRATARQTGLRPDAGTVFLATADSGGMMVSYIQSNYTGFGSGVVVPGTGISLQNRGLGFDLDPSHPNAVGPGKRSFHTIIPGFLTRNGRPWGPIGVMGGHMQPQGHVQVVRGLADFGMSPQAALDQPRWCWMAGNEIVVESGWPGEVLDALRNRGHQVTVAPDEAPFGRGQLILSGSPGVFSAGSDPRADGHAAVLVPESRAG